VRTTRRGSRASPFAAANGIDQTAATQRGPAQNAALAYVSAPVAALGGRVNALVGRARTSLNAPIPFARVLLRNVLTGQVILQTTADLYGDFQFLDLDTTAYIVEFARRRRSVVATSTMTTMARRRGATDRSGGWLRRPQRSERPSAICSCRRPYR